jgi:hypothetical protein
VAYTIAQTKERIKRDLVIPNSDWDASIVDAIHTTLNMLAGKKYWFLEASETLTVLSGTSTANLPADFGAVNQFTLINGTTRATDLHGFDFYSDFSRFQEDWRTDATVPAGTPVACAIRGNVLHVSHAVASATLIECMYFKKDASLPLAESATSVWGEEGFDVLRSLATQVFKRECMQFDETQADNDRVTLYLTRLDQQSIERAY